MGSTSTRLRKRRSKTFSSLTIVLSSSPTPGGTSPRSSVVRVPEHVTRSPTVRKDSRKLPKERDICLWHHRFRDIFVCHVPHPPSGRLTPNPSFVLSLPRVPLYSISRIRA